jgi:hypothetical protein
MGMGGSGKGKRWCGMEGNELKGGAHESAVGERRRWLAKCTTPRRKRNPAIMPRRFGPTGPMKEAVACGGRAGQHG